MDMKSWYVEKVGWSYLGDGHFLAVSLNFRHVLQLDKDRGFISLSRLPLVRFFGDSDDA